MTTGPFENLSLIKPILRAVSNLGYGQPTKIQQEAIPLALAGQDLLATAQTGTGKTAAFVLPMLQLLHADQSNHTRNPRALILSPTRELALQIDESLRAYGRYLPLRSAAVLGGVSAYSQVRALRKKPDIIVATPGRLLDLLGQRHVRLDNVEMLVLDEADRMLDMGFVHDVRKIVSHTPDDRQTMLFSATMSKSIVRLASDLLRYPSKIAIAPPASVSGKIAQKVLFVEHTDKRALLTDVLRDKDVRRALVFTRTKHRANRVAKQLTHHGISTDAIHSNKSQVARQRALSAFDRGRIKVLVATDIVARGIDVDGISHVINYELPHDPDSYVHRIGRTARAGATGIAMSFCDADEIPMLKGIEKLTRSPMTAVDDHPFHCATVASLWKAGARDRKRRGFRPRNRRRARRSTG